MNFKLSMNKKGSDIPSLLFAIGIIFAIGIFLVIMSYLSLNIYTGLHATIESIPSLSGGEANETLTKVETFEGSRMWDYFFLAIVFAYIISMTVLAFTTPTNPWLFAVFVVFSCLGLFVGVGLSNAWQLMAAQPILASTIERFPITNLLIGSFYPLFITFIMVLVMIMLFGKSFVGGGGTER